MDTAAPDSAVFDGVPAERHETTVDGTVTRWWEYGDADAAVTIVMVHGFRGDHHGLEPIVAHLSGMRAIIPDLPGFGASAAPHGELSLEAYAHWLRSFVAALDIRGRLVMLGHSFGSIIVAAAVTATARTSASGSEARQPLEPWRVVLINPIGAPALSGPRASMTALAVFYYRLGAVLPRPLGFALLRNRLIVRVMSITMAKTKDRRLRRWIHHQHDRYFSAFDDRRVVLEAFRASVENDVSMFATGIAQPTLLIAADKDDITPLAVQHRLASLFADARLVVVEGVGHLVHYEAPGRAAHAITGFLAEEDTAPSSEQGGTP